MAEKKASLIIELKDRFSKEFKGVTDVFFGVKAILGGVNQTFGRLIDLVKSSIASFAESEMAVSSLTNALKNQGFYSDDYVQSLKDQAKALSALSVHSDESIMNTQTLLTTFGLAGDKLRDTTKSALELSAGLGIDLRTSTLLLGKAWAGETGTLARYGLKLDETLTPMQKFEQLQTLIGQKFGGRSAAEAQTYTGKITQLALAWDDLKEKMGEEFAMGMSLSIVALTKMTRALDDNYTSLRRMMSVTSDTKSFEAVYSGLGVKVGLFALGWAEKLGIVQGEHAKILELMHEISQAAGTTGSGVADPKSKPPPEDKKTNTEVARTETYGDLVAERLRQDEEENMARGAIMADAGLAELANMGLMAEAKDTLRAQEMAAELDAVGQHQEAKGLIERQSVKNAEMVGKSRMQMFASSMAFISTLSSSKSKEMAAIGKAAAAAMTIRETAVAVMASYKWGASFGGPPVGAIFGGLAALAGAAQLTTIAGTPLADGGMMPFTPGGHAVTFAERKSEAAIPLDDPRTTDALARTLGPALGGAGGDTHIHISAGVIVADRVSVTEFTKLIDEELYKLGRSRQRIS